MPAMLANVLSASGGYKAVRPNPHSRLEFVDCKSLRSGKQGNDKVGQSTQW
jgi:hypothetical protein